MPYEAETYEREIAMMRPHIWKIRQDMKVAEALAKASLMTSPAAKRRLAVRSLQLGKDPEKGPDEEYVPPKDILLYLVRMGSFNSAPKILNEDHQDRHLSVPTQMSKLELLDFCAREKANSFELLRRPFQLCADSTLAEQIKQMSLTDCPPTESDPNNLRVFQWNVLSQTLGQTNDNFVKCPNDALTWDFRKFHIIEEIIQHSADVICLQEVDHFDFLQKILSTQGYEGVFYPKPDSPCVYIEGNNGPDGCAIFYKKDKFECIAKDSKILEVWKVQSNQVAVLVVLRSLETQKEFCVVTTHLKARNGALLSKLRNEQGKDLLEFIDAKSARRPVIICGDFNAEPSEPVYRTVLSNRRLGLGSAYANFLMPKDRTCDNVEPEESAAHEVPYTTWKIREEGEICHTIDYIFYSQKHLKVNGILHIPTAEDVGEGKVPSYNYPSDHFSLMCDFSFTPAS